MSAAAATGTAYIYSLLKDISKEFTGPIHLDLYIQYQISDIFLDAPLVSRFTSSTRDQMLF